MLQADMRVTGRFDGVFAVGARPLIEKLAAEERDIGVDLSEASGMDAGGLAALVALHKRLEPKGCKVRVLGANDTLLRLFETFQLADLFIEGAARPANSALRSCFFGVPAAPPAGSTKEPLANAAPRDARRHSVEAWLSTSAVAGGALRGGDALKSYKRWAGRSAQDLDAARLRQLLTAILGGDRIVTRTSGYVIIGIQLRRAITGGKRPQA